MAYIYGTCQTDSGAVGKYECRLSYSYTQNISANQSTITATLQARANNSAYSTTADFYRYVQASGETHAITTIGGNTTWKDLKTFTWTVTHDDDGTKTIHVSGYFHQDNVSGIYALYNGLAQDYVTFTPIPRYAAITNFTATVNSPSTVSCSWAADKSCSAVYYSIDNGATYSSSVGSGTSGSFTISGLTPGQTYPIKLKVKATDSGLETPTQTALSRTMWSLSTTTFASFNLGTAVTATISRASTTLVHDIAVYAKSPASSTYTLIKTYSGITGTTQSITFTSGELTTIYNLIPTYTYAHIRLTTTTKIGSTSYGSTTSSVQRGTVVDDTYSKPLFSTFTYADVDASTLALTGNNQSVIKGYSNITATITSANKAVAQKGATMVSYSFIVGSSSKTIAYSSSSTVTGTINNVTSNVMVVRAVDSRGYYREATLNATTYFNYSAPTISSATATRTDDIEKETTLAYNGAFFNYDFGDVANSVTATYSYKITTDSSYTSGGTTLTPTASGQTYSDSMLVAGDDGANGFLQVNSYNIKIVVSDQLSSVTYYALLNAGSPTLALHQDGVAIKGAYDTTGGEALQVNGNVKISGNLNGITSTEISCLDNVSSNIQTQFNNIKTVGSSVGHSNDTLTYYTKLASCQFTGDYQDAEFIIYVLGNVNCNGYATIRGRIRRANNSTTFLYAGYTTGFGELTASNFKFYTNGSQVDIYCIIPTSTYRNIRPIYFHLSNMSISQTTPSTTAPSGTATAFS